MNKRKRLYGFAIVSILIVAPAAFAPLAYVGIRSAGDIALPVQLQGVVYSSRGTVAANATVFLFEGIDVDQSVANFTTDRSGRFAVSLTPLVKFVDEASGALKSQAFVSYRILAFWIDPEGRQEFLHEFRSIRFTPNDQEKSAVWELKMMAYNNDSHASPPTAQTKSVVPGEVEPRHIDGIFPCWSPCVVQSENLFNHLTKVGEVHTTAGAETIFSFGISSAVTTDVATSNDNWVTYSVSSGNTHSEGLGATWRMTEGDTLGIDALSNFRYYRYWWHLDWGCCYAYNWQTVEPTQYMGGGYNGNVVGGDNLHPDSIPPEWGIGRTSPCNSWWQDTKDSWYFAGSVGLNIEGVTVTLGLRLESSIDTKYEANFDICRKYDYVEMVSYDRGTNGAIWYFTHRLATESLVATDETSYSVKLEWSRFGGLDFAFYEPWYRVKGSNTWTRFDWPVTNQDQLSEWVRYLASDTTYQFYVRIVENGGLYGSTAIVERTTDAGGGGGGCAPPQSPDGRVPCA